MAEVRCGVIGLGFMGARWARALAEHAGARLAVVSDVRDEVARQAAGRYGATVVSDPLEAAARGDLDAVAVCTPEHAHTAAALAAIDAGKAVMVEKPLAHTVIEAEQIRDRRPSKGCRCWPGTRFASTPAMRRCARRSKPGRSGRCRRCDPNGSVSSPTSRSSAGAPRSPSTTASTSSTCAAGTPARWKRSGRRAAPGSSPGMATRSRISTPSACASPRAPMARRWSAGASRPPLPDSASPGSRHR